MVKAEEIWKVLVEKRRVMSFDEIVEIFKIDEKTIKKILDQLEKEGYLIKGEIFGEENSSVYLAIDVNDDTLDKIRIIEIKGQIHLIAIWKATDGWKICNMYLGTLNKILREGFSKAILKLNDKNKVVFETYKY